MIKYKIEKLLLNFFEVLENLVYTVLFKKGNNEQILVELEQWLRDN